MDRRVKVQLKNNEIEYIILDPKRYSCLWNYRFALLFQKFCIELTDEILDIVNTSFPNGWHCWDLVGVPYNTSIIM